jgi:hypothetical protein
MGEGMGIEYEATKNPNEEGEMAAEECPKNSKPQGVR